MAEASAGRSLTTAVTCEGDLVVERGYRPQRYDRCSFNEVEGLLVEPLTDRKLEPWNSVRVTLSIPREAALRLRQLAAGEDGGPGGATAAAASAALHQLRALGILGVQLDGDQSVSLRTAESEVLQRQDNSNACGNANANASISQLLGASSEVAVSTEKVQFRSPNVVCPPDSIVPKVPVPSASSSSTPPASKAYAGPFPFTSMNQARHTSVRDNVATVSSVTNVATNVVNVPIAQNFQAPPPPYPGKHPPPPSPVPTVQPVQPMSSPLLVNLLNEGSRAIALSENEQRMPFISNKVQVQVRANSNIANSSKLTHYNNVVLRKPPPPPPVQKDAQLVPNKTIQTAGKQQPPNASALRNPVPYNYNNPPPYPTNPQQPTQPPRWEQQQQPPQHVPQHPPQHIQHPPQQVQHPLQHVQHPPQLQELTPLLATLGDIDLLLPSLERDLACSPVDLPELLLNDKCLPSNDALDRLETLDRLDQLEPLHNFMEHPRERTELADPSSINNRYNLTEHADSLNRPDFLINPLTGELEPKSGSDTEEEFRDVFIGLPSPSNFSDEDTNSTIRPDTTDQSDSESRSCHSDSSKHSKLKNRNREKGRDSPKPEKIKLRLKLEKSEPVSPAYKVDVSFLNAPKKAIAVPVTPSAAEELRVPPLHISLRGRNHAVINNKKKKLNPDGTPVKLKPKKEDDDERKLKKPKLSHENKFEDLAVYNHHFKEKLKERRGSDSELTKGKKYPETNGILDDKKRRLSQSEENFETQVQSNVVLGSTNTGTIASIAAAHKRKEKFKSKDLNRFKSYSKNVADKLSKQVSLPTGEIDMEAKFKQRLMEDTLISAINSISPTNTVNLVSSSVQKEEELPGLTDPKVEDLIQTLAEHKDKPPEPDKCNTPDKQDKQGRSPNSGAQGEDSGIESMDALSEKSPNQASQSPHNELPDPSNVATKNKIKVPMLEIEAQLAKMEGLSEDLNENHNSEKLEQCCVLTTLQDAVNLNVSPQNANVRSTQEQLPQVGEVKKEDEPLPLHVTPPLFTYSNPEKKSPDSPLSDTENQPVKKSSSLLEQLLIDIPENQTPSSPSPATRSVRTRASSKLNSPELNSPITTLNNKPKPTPTTKRKRLESENNTTTTPITNTTTTSTTTTTTTPDVEQQRKKPRKDTTPIKAIKKKSLEESSDSDEPLIEVAGKVRKHTQNNKVKLKGIPVSATTLAAIVTPTSTTTTTPSLVKAVPVTTSTSTTVPINTRNRAIRAPPAVNTRSKGDKSNPDSDVIRRKTRSAVSEGEGKRRKENVK